MATIGGANSLMPLNELANRLDRSGGTAELAFQFMEKNQFIEVLPFTKSSHETHHEFVKTLSIPAGTWTAVNEGVPIEGSRTKPEKEYMGTLESYSQIDVRAFRGMKKSAAAAIRLQEDKAFMTGMGLTISEALFYTSHGINTKSFDGLFTRPTLNQLSSDQVINSGASSGDVMSILVAELGDETMYGVIPKGTKAGIETEDLGREPKYDDSGNRFDVYTTHFLWDLGLVLKDDRAAVRIANISDAVVNDADDNGGLNEEDILDALSFLPNMGQKNSYIFLNRRTLRHLQSVAKDRVNVTYTPNNQFGRKWITDYMGTGIKVDERLLTTESVIS